MGAVTNSTEIKWMRSHEITSPTPIVTKKNTKLALTLVSCTRHAEEFGKFLIGSETALIFGHLRILSSLRMTITLRELYTSIALFPKLNMKRKINEMFVIISHFSSLGYATESFTNFLKSVGALKSAVWAKPLGLTGAGLEFIAMMYEVKQLTQFSKMFKEFKQILGSDIPIDKYTLQDYRKGRDFILDKRLGISKFDYTPNGVAKQKAAENPDFITDFILTDEPKIAHRLMQIESEAERMLDSGNSDEILAAKHILKNTNEALGTRFIHKKMSHRLSILSSLVSIVGMCFFLTPLAPIGYGFWVLSAVLSVGNKIYEHKTKKQFEKIMFGNLQKIKGV